MSRAQGAYLADMIEACDRVLAYTAALDAATLREDQRTLDAVVRNLEVLGEASKRVSADVRARATALPSREIAGLRDVLAATRSAARGFAAALEGSGLRSSIWGMREGRVSQGRRCRPARRR